MLFYEPKFPKSSILFSFLDELNRPFSALLRAEIPKIVYGSEKRLPGAGAFSALLRAEIPKMVRIAQRQIITLSLSVLFYEPKFPKYYWTFATKSYSYFQCSSTSRNSQNTTRAMESRAFVCPFSALLRAEIPKICPAPDRRPEHVAFSALLRAEIPKMIVQLRQEIAQSPFSALLRAEIPKMVARRIKRAAQRCTFSALLRAEIPKMRAVAYQTRDIFETFSALLRAEIPKILRHPDRTR